MLSVVKAALILLGISSFVIACSDHDTHSHARRQVSRDSSQSLIRPLQWGEVQVLHTTDIHGWYQGHTPFGIVKSAPETNYAGDWGDFASFVYHMRKLAKSKGVDLLILDSGDLHDGDGLSDGYPAGKGPDGHLSNMFHAKVDYDLLTVGNHELYVYANALDTYQNFVPKTNGRYLASNVNITYSDADGKTVTKPMGERVVKFKTDMGRQVTSIGVLFHFTGQDKNLTVQPPAEMVNEAWFKEAIQEAPDFFLLPGHMPVRKDDWPLIVNAIRAVHKDVPIAILGGHTHIRDCYIYDNNAFGLESGRYLETIGWLSFNLTKSTNNSTPFARSYIDGNRRNYAFHANLTSPSSLDTALGKNITASMNAVASAWNLTEQYGTAPQDYYLDRVGMSSNSSLLNLLAQHVLPTVISTSNPDRVHIPNFVIANSGSQRFDIYKGPFLKNDQYIVSPFKDVFLYLSDVKYKYARNILTSLNRSGGSSSISNAVTATTSPHDEAGRIQAIFNSHARVAAVYTDSDPVTIYSDATAPSLGYVTKDSCPGIGDDTEHTAIPYVYQPTYVASPLTNNVTAVGDDDAVDVVFVDFTLSSVVSALNKEQTEHTYKTTDAMAYNSLTTQDLYKLYAMKAWN